MSHVAYPLRALVGAAGSGILFVGGVIGTDRLLGLLSHTMGNLEQLPTLWQEADPSERRKLLTSMLEAVFVDTVEERAIVALRPKPASGTVSDSNYSGRPGGCGLQERFHLGQRDSG